MTVCSCIVKPFEVVFDAVVLLLLLFEVDVVVLLFFVGHSGCCFCF
jgi:hypothetical protein